MKGIRVQYFKKDHRCFMKIISQDIPGLPSPDWAFSFTIPGDRIKIYSTGFPAFYITEKELHLHIRGMERSKDNYNFDFPAEYFYDVCRILVALQKKYGNNSDPEWEDISEEKEFVLEN